MTFNEFQRELQQRGIPIKEAYLFTLIYERLIETENQLTLCAKLVQSLAESMTNFVQLNEKQQNELRNVLRGRMPDGVSVESVAWDDKED